MENIIILSNTCVGYFIYRDYLKKEYDNPFIGSLFTNDIDYINLVNNMHYYINIEPKIGQANEKSLFSLQSKNKYYYHKLFLQFQNNLFHPSLELASYLIQRCNLMTLTL